MRTWNFQGGWEVWEHGYLLYFYLEARITIRVFLQSRIHKSWTATAKSAWEVHDYQPEYP